MSRLAQGFGLICLIGLGLAVAGLADVALDDGRALYALFGRDKLVAACAPALIKQLSDEGFSPREVEFDGRPALGALWSRSRSLDADFTFQDGVAETRVDGTMSCIVAPDAVKIVVRTSGHPVRIG